MKQERARPIGSVERRIAVSDYEALGKSEIFGVMLIKSDAIRDGYESEIFEMLKGNGFYIHEVIKFVMEENDGFRLYRKDILAAIKAGKTNRTDELLAGVKVIAGECLAVFVERNGQNTAWEELCALKGNAGVRDPGTIRGKTCIEFTPDMSQQERLLAAASNRVHTPWSEEEVHTLCDLLIDKGVQFEF